MNRKKPIDDLLCVKTVRLSQEEIAFVDNLSDKDFSKNLRFIIHFYQKKMLNNEK